MFREEIIISECRVDIEKPFHIVKYEKIIKIWNRYSFYNHKIFTAHNFMLQPHFFSFQNDIVVVIFFIQSFYDINENIKE